MKSFLCTHSNLHGSSGLFGSSPIPLPAQSLSSDVEERFALQGGKNVKPSFNYRVLPTQISPKHSILGYVSGSS